METNLRQFEPRPDLGSSGSRASTLLPLRQRLALCALVTGVSWWIRVVELSDTRRDSMTHLRRELW
jgi:hypothetical protein